MARRLSQLPRGLALYAGAAALGCVWCFVLIAAYDNLYLFRLFLTLEGMALLMAALSLAAPRLRPLLLGLGLGPISLVNFGTLIIVYPTEHLLVNAVMWVGFGLTLGKATEARA